jgi:pimeloyl-ACP methyl ester carboxylesterase
LAYQVSGSGEPVLLMHGALIADAFRPLLTQSSLARGYRLIVYHRRGYGHSGPPSEPMTIERQAADCTALLRHLGVERAHIVGHSLGGAIAIQLALDNPDVVHSLAVLEPALFGQETGKAYRESLERGEQRYREAAADVVVDEFLRMRFGPDYRDAVEKVLPGAFSQAVRDSRTTFETDLPGLREWRLDEHRVKRLAIPVLNVMGGDSDQLWPRFGEVYRLVRSWLPHAEGFVLPGAAHGLMLQNPRGMAQALADFWRRHPIAAA